MIQQSHGTPFPVNSRDEEERTDQERANQVDTRPRDPTPSQPVRVENHFKQYQ